MSSLTAVASLRTWRVTRRWVLIGATAGGLAVATWLQLTGQSLEPPLLFAVLVIGGISVGLIRRHHQRRFREHAPDLMIEAYNAPHPDQLHVVRSWSDAGMSLGLILWITVTGVAAWMRPRPPLEGLPWLLGANAVGIVLIIVLVATRRRPGQPLIDLDSTGVHLHNRGFSLAWSEIDQVYCWGPRDREPGLALHVTDSVLGSGRLSRWQRRGLARDKGWVFVPEEEMRAGFAEVMAASVSLHRAATGN